jgi:hypothetical protein
VLSIISNAFPRAPALTRQWWQGQGTRIPGGVWFRREWRGGVVPLQADCGLENNELALFSTAMKHIEEKTPFV